MKEKNTSGKFTIICLIVCFGLFFSGSIIANHIHSEISIPLGLIMMFIPFLVLMIIIVNLFVKDICAAVKYKPRKGHTKTQKVWKIMGDTVGFLIMSFILITMINMEIAAVKDLFIGPKEVIINNVSIVEVKSHRYKGRVSRTFYISGNSDEKDFKIKIRGKKMRRHIETLIEKDNTIKVYYFKNINTVYEVYKNVEK